MCVNALTEGFAVSSCWETPAYSRDVPQEPRGCGANTTLRFCWMPPAPRGTSGPVLFCFKNHRV